MPVIQEAFFIPDDIATGLATGLYRRLGGVVRYAVGPNKGQIVKHLDPVKFPAANEAAGVLAKAAKIAKENKKLLIAGGIIIGFIGGGTAIYYGVKNHEPAVVKEFRSALSQYIQSIREGTVKIEDIERLMDALDELKAHRDYRKYVIKLSAEDIDVLVNRIYEYTLKLARDNNYDIGEFGENADAGPIINLQNYLNVQKKIFESAA